MRILRNSEVLIDIQIFPFGENAYDKCRLQTAVTGTKFKIVLTFI